jgi:fucose permease
MFILYTGIEVTAGQWTFTLLTEERGFGPGAAGTWVSAYYLGLTAGRIGLGMLTAAVPARRLLRFSIGVSVLAAALFWLDFAPWAAFIGLVLLGLSFGPVFPSLISTTPDRIGRSHTPNAIGFQISAAAVGAALMPLAVGLIADATTLEAVSVSLLVGTVALFLLYEAIERRVGQKR